MKKKEKGSTLVMLMMMGMLVSILSAASISAILSSTKNNTFVKNYQDLFYSAESGIELGIALIKNDVRYLKSKDNMFFEGQIAEKANRLIADGSDAVHSVDISIDSEVNTRARIKSVAYGYDENGDKDLNNKRAIEKTISRKTKSNLLAGDLLKNSIVAEDKININGPTINMQTTQITAGGGVPILNKLGDMKPPEIKDDKFSTPIFKSNGNSRSLPNIRKQSVVKIDRLASNISNNSLFVNATPLASDGTTIAENGIGKIYSLPDGIGDWATYNVIVVNADKLIIEPPTFGLNENKVVIICSGDIEVKLDGDSGTNNQEIQAVNMTDTTLFGKNVTMTVGASVTIARAPRLGEKAEQLSDEQIKKIDEILSMYIENWGTNDGGGDNNTNDDWQVIDSESVYE